MRKCCPRVCSWRRCSTTGAGDGPDSSENSGDPAVGAALGQGCGHARRCSTTGAGLDVQKTADYPQFQFISRCDGMSFF